MISACKQPNIPASAFVTLQQKIDSDRLIARRVCQDQQLISHMRAQLRMPSTPCVALFVSRTWVFMTNGPCWTMGSPMGLPAMSRNLSGVLGSAEASRVLPAHSTCSKLVNMDDNRGSIQAQDPEQATQA